MIKVIAVGKIKEKALQSCIEEYIKRIRPFTKFELVEVKDESIPNVHSLKVDEEILRVEGERILSKIKDKEYVILLDLHGKNYKSEEVAKKLSEIVTYESSDISFVIGGSLGVSSQLVQRANLRWKLSDCTFPHQLVRLLVCEQIYRSYTILNHLPYHK